MAQLIADEYGIVPASIVEGPRGWMAETFIVTAADGRRVFAKLLDTPEHFLAAVAALPVLEALRAAGIANLSFPLRTQQGQIAVDFAGRRLIVLEFIEGHQGSHVPFDFASYVRSLARIHTASLALPPDVPQEGYGLPFATSYVRIFEWALHEPGATAPQQEMQRFLRDHEAEIREIWAEMLALPEECRRRDAPFVITHSDAFEHNLLITAEGGIFFIDWDELKLGPVERDSWYYVLNCETRRAFLSAYRETFPDYHPDMVLCRYYLLRRFFEDLEGYLLKIIESQSVEEQRRLLTDVTGSWTNWLWPLINQA